MTTFFLAWQGVYECGKHCGRAPVLWHIVLDTIPPTVRNLVMMGEHT